MDSKMQKSVLPTLIIGLISMLISAASFYYIGNNDAIINQMKYEQSRPKYEEIKSNLYCKGNSNICSKNQARVNHIRQKVLMYGSYDNIYFFLLDSCYIDEPIYKLSK